MPRIAAAANFGSVTQVNFGETGKGETRELDIIIARDAIYKN